MGTKSDPALLPLAWRATEHMFNWAATLPDDLRSALRKHALATQKEQRLHAMINLAKGEPTIRAEPKQFDANPWLLGCDDVTVDLRARKSYFPMREDFITKSTGIVPDRNGACSNWLATLAWAMEGDAETIEHLQRIAGYMLTGSVSEEKLFAFFGGGANGKTTIAMTLFDALGDYAAKGRRDLLLQSQGERGAASPDVAALHGNRLVVVSETDEGCAIAEAQLKEIPRMNPSRRGNCIATPSPSTQAIGALDDERLAVREGQRRRHMAQAEHHRLQRQDFLLRQEPHFREEKLRWNCREFRMDDRGLLQVAARRIETVGCVTRATKAYRSEMDYIQHRLDEPSAADPQASIPRSEAYCNFKSWSDLSTRRIGNRRFVEELHMRGFHTTKSTGSDDSQAFGCNPNFQRCMSSAGERPNHDDSRRSRQVG